MKRLLFVGVLVASFATVTAAATIDVLWYGVDSSYNTAISGLAASAHTYDPDTNGSNTWNLTFWNAGDATPDFTAYDVFVVGSSDQGFFTSFDDTRLLAAGIDTSVNAARGNRTFLSGQDADWHYQFGPGAVDNGPRGFLINAVNWAASGTGLGIVALADGFSGNPNGWMTDPGSFLDAELSGFVSYIQNESVTILPGQSGFPVNEGLTSGGLSNWGVSSHSAFNFATPGYEPINGLGASTTLAVTIVTDGQAGGGTTPGGQIPEPSTLVLLGLGLTGLGVTRKRRRS